MSIGITGYKDTDAIWWRSVWMVMCLLARVARLLSSSLSAGREIPAVGMETGLIVRVGGV